MRCADSHDGTISGTLGNRLQPTGPALLVLADETGREYCEGDGSICEAFDGLDVTCDKETGPKCYKSICETKWVRTDKA